MASLLKLDKKEARLFNYKLECEDKGHRPTIGEICKACHTTPRTLLCKTGCSLKDKIATYEGGVDNDGK